MFLFPKHDDDGDDDDAAASNHQKNLFSVEVCSE